MPKSLGWKDNSGVRIENLELSLIGIILCYSGLRVKTDHWMLEGPNIFVIVSFTVIVVDDMCR
jgi:hypothetical protein